MYITFAQTFLVMSWIFKTLVSFPAIFKSCRTTVGRHEIATEFW